MKKTLKFLVFSFLIQFFLFPLGSGYAAEAKPFWWELAERSASREGYGLISVFELSALYDSGRDFVIVDVRPDYEFRAGHLPRAGQLEFDLADRSRLETAKREQFERILGPDKDRDVIVYCRNYQ